MEQKFSILNKEELKQRLTKTQWEVTQNKDTERVYSSKYYKFNEKGVYQCICCFEDLFLSEQKYDTKCGWPAFYDSLKDNILEIVDSSRGRRRVEVVCKYCKAHLGHIYNDGPKPNGIRYCINGASLHFKPILQNKI